MGVNKLEVEADINSEKLSAKIENARPTSSAENPYLVNRERPLCGGGMKSGHLDTGALRKRARRLADT